MRFLSICGLALLWAGPVFAAGASAATNKQVQFETRLSPSPHIDGTPVDRNGDGRAHATLDGNKLTVRADFQGLSADATTAGLYDGEGIAIPGAKAFDLTVSQGRSGTVSGTVTLSVKQIADVRAGHFYVQINSQKAAEINLTGWLLPPHPSAGEDVPVEGDGLLPQLGGSKAVQ